MSERCEPCSSAFLSGRLKICLGHRGVAIREDVRRPLRTLTPDERAELEAWLESS